MDVARRLAGLALSAVLIGGLAQVAVAEIKSVKPSVASSAGGGAGKGRDCFVELAKLRPGKARPEVFACEFPTRLTDEERADLKRLTRETLLDATCVVSIRIERGIVEAALQSADHVFEAPPQPVRCEVITSSTVYPITATFAPRVVFTGDVAVEGSPGLDNVEGVSRYLSWPVVQYVNRSPGIKKSMLEMINVYRGIERAAARPKPILR